MSARPVKLKDPMYSLAIQRSGSKCEVAVRLRFGATDMHGDKSQAIVQLCGAPIEGVYWQDENVGTVAMCKPCRLKVFGATSSEKRKATMARKDAQLPLLVRAKTEEK